MRWRTVIPHFHVAKIVFAAVCMTLSFLAVSSALWASGSVAGQDYESPGSTFPTAQAQQLSMEKGKLKATGSISANGADGSGSLSDNGESWAWQVGGRAGMLNEEFAVGVNAAGGWSPGGDWGLWLNLDGEFTGEYADHYQATLNAGYRFSPGIKLLATLDYLSKTIDVESWDQDEMLSQYGAGLSMDYTLFEALSLSGFYQHYKTEGKEYGKVGEYDYVDSANWQHFGYIYGAVRGGDYDEVGIDATYRLPGTGMDFGLGLSQIWRTYESMLGYDSKSTEAAAGRLNYGWSDIMQTGVNFRADMSMEFADSNNLSWSVSLDKRMGDFSLGLTYSEYSNDQATSDRRLYASISLPLGAEVKPEPAAKGPGKPAFSGMWIVSPVTGMGRAALKVSEQLERWVDQTEVDLNQLSEGVTISKNMMTFSGLPVLTGINTDYSQPASALAAFSIDAGNTSVIVDIGKLPKPASVRAVFDQQNGKYTLISFETEEGSTKITNQGLGFDLNKATMTQLMESALSLRPFAGGIILSGPSVIEAGKTYTFSFRPGDHESTGIYFDEVKWSVTGNAVGIDAGSSVQGNIRVTGKSPGRFGVIGVGIFHHHDSDYYNYRFASAAHEGIVVSDSSGSGSGGSGTVTDCGFISGTWSFWNSRLGFTLQLGVDAGGNVVFVQNSAGSALSSVSSAVNCNNGSLTGTVSCTVGTDSYSYGLNLNMDNGLVQSGSTISESVNGGSATNYTVSGQKL